MHLDIRYYVSKKRQNDFLFGTEGVPSIKRQAQYCHRNCPDSMPESYSKNVLISEGQSYPYFSQTRSSKRIKLAVKFSFHSLRTMIIVACVNRSHFTISDFFFHDLYLRDGS